jgi:hypothetical protein
MTTVYCVMFKSFSGCWMLDGIFINEDVAKEYIIRDVAGNKTRHDQYKLEPRLVLTHASKIVDD